MFKTAYNSTLGLCLVFTIIIIPLQINTVLLQSTAGQRVGSKIARLHSFKYGIDEAILWENWTFWDMGIKAMYEGQL